MKYRTLNNHIAKSIYRSALEGDFRSVILQLSFHRPHLSVSLFCRLFCFVVEKTPLIDNVKNLEPEVRSFYYSLLDFYLKQTERGCNL